MLASFHDYTTQVPHLGFQQGFYLIPYALLLASPELYVHDPNIFQLLEKHFESKKHFSSPQICRLQLYYIYCYYRFIMIL